jgi:hypothetical protein
MWYIFKKMGTVLGYSVQGLYYWMESVDWFKTVDKRSCFLLKIRTNSGSYPTFYSVDIRFFTLG